MLRIPVGLHYFPVFLVFSLPSINPFFPFFLDSESPLLHPQKQQTTWAKNPTNPNTSNCYLYKILIFLSGSQLKLWKILPWASPKEITKLLCLPAQFLYKKKCNIFFSICNFVCPYQMVPQWIESQNCIYFCTILKLLYTRPTKRFVVLEASYKQFWLLSDALLAQESLLVFLI